MSAIASGEGEAAPGGLHAAHTAPPSAMENALWGPAAPQFAQS